MSVIIVALHVLLLLPLLSLESRVSSKISGYIHQTGPGTCLVIDAFLPPGNESPLRDNFYW